MFPLFLDENLSGKSADIHRNFGRTALGNGAGSQTSSLKFMQTATHEN